MNILQMVNRACTRAKMPSIVSLEDNTNPQAREYLEYANQAVETILRYSDWRVLAKDWSVITTDNQIEIPLPEDFGGFLVNQIYDRTRNLYLQNADDDISLQSRAAKISIDIPFWRVLGNNIVFDFPLKAGRELLMAYKSKYAVITQEDSESVRTELFSKNADTFILNDQALIAGILAAKSMAYQDTDLQSNQDYFLNVLAELKEKDGARRKINIFGRGSNRISPTEYQPYIAGDL